MKNPMLKFNENGEAVCWKCDRVIEPDAKFGMCADCTNKYGTPALSVAGVVAAILAKRYGPRAIEFLAKFIKK